MFARTLPLLRPLLLLLVLLAGCLSAPVPAHADEEYGGTRAFARWYLVPSSYPPAPFSRELKVFEFGAETEGSPHDRIQLEASVNTMMRSQVRGGVISSVDYRVGGYYRLAPAGFLSRFGLGFDHGSWHNIDAVGRVQVFNRVEVRARL